MNETTQKPPANRYRNGSPWRDPDVLQVMVVGTIAVLATFGGLYLWALGRTWRCARTAGCEAGAQRFAIVFGKRLQDGRPDRDYRWRLRRALELLRRHPDLVVLVSGGRSGPSGEVSEAECGRDWLLRRLPAAAARVRIEAGSIDTVDNLRMARSLLPGEPVLLISNRYHLARCRLLAKHLAIPNRPCAAEPGLRVDRRFLPRLFLEAGYHTLFVVGRVWARLIGHQRMISRVS